MQLFNLMASTITLFGETYDISLNFIGKIIRWMIGGVGSVGLGVIIFSVVLKVIVLPFDIYQRIAMRKQNIKMKENQSKMEKLQKQYANDKEMYNKKLMEMYKANGISMFSSCLPMILSMVIFIVAINAFNAYSQYAAIENYNHMVNSYNAQLMEYAPEKNADFVFVSSDGEYKKYTVKEDGKYIYIEVKLKESEIAEKYPEFNVTDNVAIVDAIYSMSNMSADKYYYIDVDAMKNSADVEMKLAIENWTDKVKDESTGEKYTEEDACLNVLIGRAQKAVKADYDDFVKDKTSFLWIKNVWQTDATFKHPVLKYSDFKSAAKSEKFAVDGKKVKFDNLATDAYDQNTYNIVTQNLSTEKGEANGYYVLIVLSIGTILLQQWISMRSQTEHTKYSSVDGQGASQQKMTMVIMTVMFAIFAFMYSAAFSLYMIVGNILSLVMTVLINKVVDVVERKKEEKALQEQYNKRFPGRGKDGKKAKKSGKTEDK